MTKFEKKFWMIEFLKKQSEYVKRKRTDNLVNHFLVAKFIENFIWMKLVDWQAFFSIEIYETLIYELHYEKSSNWAYTLAQRVLYLADVVTTKWRKLWNAESSMVLTGNKVRCLNFCNSLYVRRTTNLKLLCFSEDFLRF